MSRLVAIIEIRDPVKQKVWTTIQLHDHHMADDERLGELVREGVLESLVKALRDETRGIIAPCGWCGSQMIPFVDSERTGGIPVVRYHCSDSNCRGHEEAHEL
jgi:hypothetical protein